MLEISLFKEILWAKRIKKRKKQYSMRSEIWSIIRREKRKLLTPEMAYWRRANINSKMERTRN